MSELKEERPSDNPWGVFDSYNGIDSVYFEYSPSIAGASFLSKNF